MGLVGFTSKLRRERRPAVAAVLAFEAAGRERGLRERAVGDWVLEDRVAGDLVAGDLVAGDRLVGDWVAGDRAAEDRAAGDRAVVAVAFAGETDFGFLVGEADDGFDEFFLVGVIEDDFGAFFFLVGVTDGVLLAFVLVGETDDDFEAFFFGEALLGLPLEAPFWFVVGADLAVGAMSSFSAIAVLLLLLFSCLLLSLCSLLVSGVPEFDNFIGGHR